MAEMTTDTDTKTETDTAPCSYTQLAVALRYDLTLTRFAETHAPSKQKHANLSVSDRKRFAYYDIIVPVGDTMGSEIVWQLADWAERLLAYTTREQRQSIRPDKQTRDALGRHGARLAEIWHDVATETEHPYWDEQTFLAREAGVDRSTMRHWSDYGFIEEFRHTNTRSKPTTWRLTAQTRFIIDTYEAVVEADPSLVADDYTDYPTQEAI